jgi:hypothetical protein
MLTGTETLLKTLYSVTDRCSLIVTSHWLVRGGFLYDFTEQQAAPVSIFGVKIAALGGL